MKRLTAIALTVVLSPVAASTSDVVCEAATLFYEASTEPLKGKRAVLDTVRFRAKALGLTSCQIVQQKSQFSFVHKKFKWHITQDMLDTWQKIDRMAPVLPQAFYFNSGKRVRKYKLAKKIGQHYFYYRK